MTMKKTSRTNDVASPIPYAEVRTPSTHEHDDPPHTKDTTKGKLVPLAQLFKYADTTDHVLMVIGTIAAIIAGIAEPIQIVLWGDVTNALNPTEGTTEEEFKDSINRVALNLVLVGIAELVSCFLQVSCWAITASRQAKRIRSAYVGAILTQEVAWFDVNEPMQLATRVADSTVTIQEGMGRKIGDAMHFASMAVTGLIIGLIKGWELALILIAFTPALAYSAYLSMKVLADATQVSVETYAKAGAIAEESLSNIRTVHMFNAIQYFVDKYQAALEFTTKAGIKKSVAVGGGLGFMFFTAFCTYACGFFFGMVMILNDYRDGCTGDSCYDGGRVLIVFFSVLMGAMALGQAGPGIQAFFSARAAAYDVFEVIDRQSLINPLAEDGMTLDKVHGKIEIENVTFSYPSRPDVKVCSDYSLTIHPGETVALVGPSGSGKSTIVSLLERFYDPQAGSVKVDGVNIRELNIKWLRQQISLVGQEPALFATSIMENIRHGRPSATDEEVIQAAKMANAYTFIKEFPHGFQTEVGERGAQLSGGQKQRIAIARAIIKNPAILLLDEATSALDTESEHIVQESLDQLLATSNRTTIIIAHRLSTIRNADKIAVHHEGAIVELGTHDELIQNPNGHYRLLVEAQSRKKDVKEADDDELAMGSPRGTQLARAHSTGKQFARSQSTHSKKDADGTDDSSELSDDKSPDVSILRIWKMSLPEWRALVLGSMGAIVNAATFPVWGVLLTKVIVLFFETGRRTRDDLIDTTRWWSLGFIGLGFVFGGSIALQYYGFGVTSQRLVARVRLTTYRAILQQEIGWFDLDENSSGALVSRLATDSATLQAVTSDTLNQGLVNVTTLVIGFGISFYYSWEMTLVLLATTPLWIFAAYVQAQMMGGTVDSKVVNEADTAAGAMLSEAIGSIRTVASFSMEQALKNAYVTFLDASNAADKKTGMIGGATFGFAQGLMFFNLGFLFWLGGKWVREGRITFEEMFMVLNVIMVSTFAIGMAAQNMTDQTKVKKAARRIFKILDRTPEIDSTSTDGATLMQVNGEIEFKGVAFSYPSRPEAPVYKNYNLKIKPGQTVALVGASGSGKSTAIALMERFYEPASGSVSLDGVDLRDLSLPWLRDRISLVSQEPVLFAGTIAENIGMGKPGATRDEIIDAAKKANAYDFISNFPDGFDTEVGDRGAQVSGGQKQRIAIARAILRDPEVLLLDEATSALDNESERIVQESLDRLLALKKRTTIIVAHRLSTIRHADLIAVTREGAIVEQGTHDQLMAISDGVYRALVARQMNSSTH